MTKMSDKAFYLAQDLEVNIRGRYLRFSASVEGLLTKCIVYLNEVKTIRTGKEEHIDFNNFTFYKKEDKFKKLLEAIYNDLFGANHELFDKLQTFREMRNKMAHCYFTWDESNLSNVTIWDLEDKCAKPHRIIPTTFKLLEISDLLGESMRAITERLNQLTSEIIKRVQPEIPHMFD